MDPGLRRTLLALTFVTGIVDAVTFLGLGQVFAAMQTGNVIFLGLGIAGTAGAPFLAPLVALTAFVAGGAAAALLARRDAAAGAQGMGAALALEVALLAGAAILAAVADVVPDELAAYALIALLALAMGLRNTVVRGFGGPNLATTVLNLTVTALTMHSPLGLASGSDLAERAAAFVAILAGAVTGALLVQTDLWLPIATAAAITLAAGLAHLRTRASSASAAAAEPPVAS
ncbi:MAG TPA: YoaK family protein [Solirubrobacterales bacterium]|nr:YoaK family protein [Solirubrobacterales bacterium]